LQVARVARTRGLSDDAVRRLVLQNTRGRQFGILGEPGVNVLKLNLAVDEAAPGKSGVQAKPQ
jgi:K+-transporting ATPase ATPase C chain